MAESELSAEQIESAAPPNLAADQPYKSPDQQQSEADAIFAELDGTEPAPVPRETQQQDLEEQQPEVDEPEVLDDVELDEPQPQDIDYDQDIPLPDDRGTMKLGEMKDKVVELERATEKLSEREHTVNNQQAELTQLLQAVGEMPPQLRERAEHLAAVNLRTNYEQMLVAIPEMKTQEGFDAVTAQVRTVGNDYGVSEQEMGSITDRRIIQMMKDFSDLKAKLEGAGKTVAKIKETRSAGQRKPHKSKQSRSDRQYQAAVKSADRGTKLAAIENLIG